MRLRLGADGERDLRECLLRPRPQRVEQRVDHAEQASREVPVVVVAPVAVVEHQADVAGVVVVGRALLGGRVPQVLPPVDLQQVEVRGHGVQGLVPGGAVVHPRLPGMDDRGQSQSIDDTAGAEVVVLRDQPRVHPPGEGPGRLRVARIAQH
jgi:hypothetical protein